MNIVIFDMEWNIGYKPYLFDYMGSLQKLRGEIIQIGAVKVNEKSQIIDKFSANICPNIFNKLHFQVAKVTGLSMSDLKTGNCSYDVLNNFKNWCGEDAIMCEWGIDDVPVLKQNLILNKMDSNWPKKWCDLQTIFREQYCWDKEHKMTLESVVQDLNINQDLQFHNALSDATYTARVCEKIDIVKGIKNLPSRKQQLLNALNSGDKLLNTEINGPMLNKGDCHNDIISKTFRCPICKNKLKNGKSTFWLKKSNTNYYTIVNCEKCGTWMVKSRLSRYDGIHWYYAIGYKKPTAKEIKRWKDNKEKPSNIQNKTKKKKHYIKAINQSTDKK